MYIPAPAITCVRTHHAQYQKKTNESFWYCAWCLRTHVIAGAGRHFPVLLPPSTLHTRQKVLKTEQIWTSIRGMDKVENSCPKNHAQQGTRGRNTCPPPICAGCCCLLCGWPYILSRAQASSPPDFPLYTARRRRRGCYAPEATISDQPTRFNGR